MKTNHIIVVLLAASCLFGCSVSRRLERRNVHAIVTHTNERQRQDTNTFRPDFQKYTRPGGEDFYIVPAVINGEGERMMNLHLQEVVVTARARTLPERLGHVVIDFVVTVPKEIQGTCQSVSVIPVLHTDNADQPLEKVTIRGALFRGVQDRSYWQYGKYLRVYRPDSLRARRMFDRLVRHPYAGNVRLDSVTERRGTLSYYYRQRVRTSDKSNLLRITLDGTVEALDGSRYRLPPSDTLEYRIASMLSFIDTTTRYVDKIVKRHEVVEDRNCIAFRLDDTRIVDTLGDNASQLACIYELMNRMLNSAEFHVDTVTLTASASPEGAYRHNERLAEARARSLRDELAARFSLPDTLVTVRWIAEDWTELGRLIRNDDQICNGPAILALIRKSSDRDRLETEIQGRYPDDYERMREVLYPKLRAVTFRYSLRRVGMTADTIHTTVPDTAYHRGVELLRCRQYAAALRILHNFRDRNTAICLLSLGYDDRAQEILAALPPSPARDYLLAIACARIGSVDEALRHYRTAAAADNRLKFRGRLDPELANLLKHPSHE